MLRHKDYAQVESSYYPLPAPGITIRVVPGPGALEHARDQVRTLIASGLPAGGIRVELSGGEYEMESALLFDERDSGTPYAPVVWQSAPGETALISGGKRLETDWFSPISSDDPMYARFPRPERVLVCDLQAHGMAAEPFSGSFGQACHGQNSLSNLHRPGDAWQELFWGDEPLTTARYPREGYLRTTGCGEIADGDCPHEAVPLNFGCEDPFVWSLPDMKDVYIHGNFFFDWANAVVPAGEMDRENHRLTAALPVTYGARDNMRFCLSRVPEAMEMPGEYLLKTDTNRVYLIPPENWQEKPLRLSYLCGDMLRLEEASHIHFRNMELAYARGTGATIMGGKVIAFEGCRIYNIGHMAIRFGQQDSSSGYMPDRIGKGGRDHLVRACDIWNTGFCGVYVSAGNRELLEGCNIRVENCDMHDFSRIGRCYCFAVNVSGVGIVVRNNRFHGGHHAAIWFCGNDNIIEYNEFYDLLRESDDASCIYCGRDYTLGGNIVRYNFFHDMASDAKTNLSIFGTYCDDQTASLVFYGNVYYRMQGAHHSHGGHDIIFENNLIVEKTDNSRFSVTFMPYYYPNTLTGDGVHMLCWRNAPTETAVWRNRFPHLYEYSQWDLDVQVHPHYCSYQHNAFIRHLPMERFFPWDTPEYHNVLANNLHTEEDAGFVDEENLDLRLREDSIIYRSLPGFKPIPFEKIGLYKDEFRK